MRVRLLGFAVACCTMAGAWAIDVPLSYHRHPERQEVFLPYGSIQMELKLSQPEGTWKLPELKGKQPLYALPEIAGVKHLLALARVNESDEFYTQLFFDVNANGDLTDDPPVQGTIEKEGNPVNYLRVEFPNVDITYQEGGKTLPYCIRITGQVWNPGEFEKATIKDDEINRYFYMQLSVQSSYSGKFTEDGVTYSVALGDSNGNGRFDDKASPVKIAGPAMRSQPAYFEGDQFYLSTKGRPDYRDGWRYGELLSIKGKVYEVTIDIPGERMTLTPTTRPLVPLKLATETDRLALYGGNESPGIMLFQPGAAANVPKGTYKLVAYQLRRKDKDGNEWLLAAMGARETESVTVGEKGNAALTFGEPFVPFAEIPPWSRHNDQLQLQFCAEGAGKELITDLSRLSGTGTTIAMSKKREDRPKEPTYKIITGDGEVAAQGRFEYG